MSVVPDDLRIPIPYPPNAGQALRDAIDGYNLERSEAADAWDAALADALNAVVARDNAMNDYANLQVVAVRRRQRLLAAAAVLRSFRDLLAAADLNDPI